MKNKLRNNLFQFDDLALTQLCHTIAESSIWFEENMHRRIATYDLVVREMPEKRNFLVFAGLEEIVYYLRNLRYTEKDIEILKKGNLVSPGFAKYLRGFRFRGTVSAMPEGTIFFPGEPVVRIVANIIEASLVEIALFNIVVSNALFASKAARYRSVAPGSSVIVGMQRAQSFESGMKAVRAGYICGLATEAWANFVRKYDLPAKTRYVVNGQHLYVKSFSTELESFEKMAQYFPDNASFMIDTYDVKQGLANAITVGKRLRKIGKNLRFITLDSGDLEVQAKWARKELDRHDLKHVGIMVATNLDEYKIQRLRQRRAPINLFVTATEYDTCADSPKMEVVYKMAEVRDGDTIHYTAKLTPGKESYPGRKQVYRRYDRSGEMSGDVVGLENEHLGAPLLKIFMKNGTIIRRLPSLPEIRKQFERQYRSLPRRLLNINRRHNYPVRVSAKVVSLFNRIKRTHTR